MANARETLVEAVRSQLETAVVPGGTYEFPPAAVHRQTFMPEGFTPDATQAVQGVYYLWPEAGMRQLGPQSCEITGQVQLAIRAYKKLRNLTENPSSGNEPERWQYQNGMFEDICSGLFSDIYFGGAARRIVDGAVFGDWGIQEEGYACVEVRFTVEYATDRPGR